MCQLKDLLGGICDKVRSNIELDCQCHVLFAFMHSQFKDIVKLCEVQGAIQKMRENVPYVVTYAPSSSYSYRSIHVPVHSRDPGELLPHAASSLLNHTTSF